MKKVDTKNLAHVLLEMTDGKTEEECKNATKEFAKYLSKNNLLSSENKIISQYRSLYNSKHNILETTVTLLNRMPEKTKLELRETLKKKYKAREVHILEKVDARIIGGMKIKIEDEVWDQTLLKNLSQLETQLLK